MNIFYKILFLGLMGLFSLKSYAAETILVLGDSLSAAYHMDPQQSWVALLETRLNQEHWPYEVINASVSGATTSNGVSSLPKALEEYHPKIVIIALGSNDGLRGLDIETMKQNLNKMIDMATAEGAKILLVGFMLPSNYGPLYTAQFEAAFKDVSKHYRLIEVPFLLEGIALDPNYTLPDGLHPNAKAQPIILDNVWPYLKKLL